MTTIIVFRTESDTYIASDSQVTTGNAIDTIDKIFEKNDIVFAIAGQVALKNAIEKLDFNNLDLSLNPYDFGNKILSEITITLSNENWIDGSIIMVKNGIPILVSYNTTLEIKNMTSIGSGSQFALGSLQTNLENGLNPEESIKKAIEIASKNDPFTDSNIRILKIPVTDKENTKELMKFEITKSNEDGYVEGIASTTDIDSDFHIISPEAMDYMVDYVKINKTKLCYEHQKDIGEVLALEKRQVAEDKFELSFKGKINLLTNLGKEIRNDVKNGNISQVSIAGIPRRSEIYNDYIDNPNAPVIQKINKLDLTEISLVRLGKNKNTRLNICKSESLNSRKDIERHLKSKGFSDSEATTMYSIIRDVIKKDLSNNQGELDKKDNINQGELDKIKKENDLLKSQLSKATKIINKFSINLK